MSKHIISTWPDLKDFVDANTGGGGVDDDAVDEGAIIGMTSEGTRLLLEIASVGNIIEKYEGKSQKGKKKLGEIWHDAEKRLQAKMESVLATSFDNEAAILRSALGVVREYYEFVSDGDLENKEAACGKA